MVKDGKMGKDYRRWIVRLDRWIRGIGGRMVKDGKMAKGYGR
jgi:hypothetical protein